ncbi:SCO2322 family protein [Kitasatospora sp. NPDC094028]
MAVLVPLLLLVAAVPAEAAGYRYWSFWRGSATDGGAANGGAANGGATDGAATDGGWAYQQAGPAVAVPPDGAVDGWRFAVSPDGGRQAAKPRAAARFDVVCAATPPREGRKRVAVVLDFGTAEDAGSSAAQPPEQRTACASVAPRATSAEVLAAVAPPLRYDTNGLLCAIAGYPQAGCGEQVAAGAADRPAEHRGDTTGSGPGGGLGSGAGPDIGLVTGGALIAALAAGAAWQTRRRRHP